MPPLLLQSLPREPASPAEASQAETAPPEATPATAGRKRADRLRSGQAVPKAKGKRNSGSASPAGPLLESPGHGAYSRAGHDTFSVAMMNLLQGAPGNNVLNGAFFGTERIHWDATVNERKGTIDGPWSSTVTDPNGNVLFALSGTRATPTGHYPGWAPNAASPLLTRCLEVYRREFGADAGIQVIHAGLECGLIGARFPGMDMVSFGPTIRGAHAPGESVKVSSVAQCWQLLKAILAEAAGPDASPSG